MISKLINVPFLTKIFVWSIVMEPVLYYAAITPNAVGISLHIGRFLQIIVIVGLLSRLLIVGRIKYTNVIKSFSKPIWIYLFIVVATAVLGLLFFDSYDFQYSTKISVRPFLEIFVIFFTFGYYVFLSLYFLNSRESINYFFVVSLTIYLFSFSVGVVDLIGQYLFSYPAPEAGIAATYTGGPSFDLVSRQATDQTNVGNRFHGLFGEPRDTFGALMLWIGILYLRDFWIDTKKTKPVHVAIIFIAGFLTFSISAIISIVIAIGLILLFYIPLLKFSQQIKTLATLALLAAIISIAIFNTPRFAQYAEDFKGAASMIVENKKIGGQFLHQTDDIVVVIKRVNEIKDLNFLQLLIGSGMGSSSYVNITYKEETNNKDQSVAEISNPRSQLIKIFYEGGILGLLLFIYIFVSFMKRQKLLSHQIYIYMLIILGCFLGHRSYGPFIYLGVVLAVMEQKKLLRQIDNKEAN